MNYLMLRRNILMLMLMNLEISLKKSLKIKHRLIRMEIILRMTNYLFKVKNVLSKKIIKSKRKNTLIINLI